MPRVKGGVRGARRRKRILKMAEGYQGSHRTLVATARRVVERAYAYRDRRVRKREFRQLWITRINAAARAHDITYSRFMEGLRKANVTLDRKVLAEIAVHDAEGFAGLVQIAKKNA
jgi:large subunit ribosomal protein L20